MKKRFLPLLLAICMLLCIPVAAAENDAEAYKNGSLTGVSAAPNGSLLVCDTWNKVVWRIEGDTVECFAGVIPVADLSGEPQGVYHDDKADKAYFAEPWDVAPFLNGWAVSDAGADVVRYIEDGTVYTLVGSGKTADNDGTDKTASFDRPTGLAVDDNGILYVADTGNGAIRRVAKDGTVSTWAEGLSEPMGLCWYDGALYVAETGRSRILRVTNGRMEILAGVSDAAEEAGEYYGGYADGPTSTARFDHPHGVAVGDDGTVYVADTLNRVVRVIRNGRVYTLVKSVDGISSPVSPSGAAVHAKTLYITDAFAGGVLGIALEDQSYTDVPTGAWYAANVMESTRRGLVNGTGNNTFSPSSSLTRAMFVTMLSRLHRSTDGTARIDGNGSFDDLEEGEYYAAAGRWAIDKGVVEGIDGLFRSELAISREQIAAMLYRYAVDQDYDVTETMDFTVYTDAIEVSDWAENALRWAIAVGVMQGGDGLLRPGDPATRAEAVTMLLNFMDAYAL